MTPYYEDSHVRLFLGDCREVLPTLEAGSVDLIATDPPYFNVKSDTWDRQWESPAYYLRWLRGVRDQWHRLLKPSGSLYCFASPQMANRVESLIAGRFNVLQRITWAKPLYSTKAEMNPKEWQRQYFPVSEAVIFADKGDLGKTLRAARRRAGLSSKEVCGLIGSHGAVNHGGAVCNWELGLNVPSREQYEALANIYPLPSYEAAVRPFTVTPDSPYTDVWTFPTVNTYPGKHPCEKPLAMLLHMVEVSSRPGGVVLDCFAGSGTTLRAAKDLGRKAVGVEIEERYCELAAERLSQGVLAFE